MQIPKECKIEKACDPKARRYPGMRHARLVGDNLVASDGRVIAVVPVIERDEGDTDGYISVEALAAARKASGHWRGRDAVVLANSELTVPGAGVKMLRPKESEYPNWAAVLPDKGRGKLRIGLNAKLLHNLADALGSEVLWLEISEPGNVVRVDGQRGAYGAIMPVVKE